MDRLVIKTPSLIYFVSPNVYAKILSLIYYLLVDNFNPSAGPPLYQTRYGFGSANFSVFFSSGLKTTGWFKIAKNSRNQIKLKFKNSQKFTQSKTKVKQKLLAFYK